MENGGFDIDDDVRSSLCISNKPVVDDNAKVEAQACALDGPDDLTCAICLGQTPVTDIATVKGCDHCYCVNCILEWTTHKESPWCPQCKQPFSYLYCYRQLDGSLTDYPCEESVVLLKRAHWFQDFMKAQDQQRCKVSPREERGGPAAGNSGGDWFNEFYDDFEEDDPDDFYFSSAAGNARVVLGNRRWGENGYMRSGRMYARPVPAAVAPAAKSSKNPRKARNNDVVSGSPPAGAGGVGAGSPPPAAAAALHEPKGKAAAPGSSPPQGRRAKRNAKRAVVDQAASL